MLKVKKNLLLEVTFLQIVIASLSMLTVLSAISWATSCMDFTLLECVFIVILPLLFMILLPMAALLKVLCSKND